MKILRVGTELFDADGQMDITKLVIAFHNFMKALKILWNLNEGKDQVMLSIHILLSMVRKHFVQELPNCKKKI
jgi:hypothetical protein